MDYMYIDQFKDLDLNKIIEIDKNTKATKPIIAEFLNNNEKYIVIKDFLIQLQNDAGFYISFLMSKSISKCSNKKVEHEFTLTELKGVIKNNYYWESLTTDIFNCVDVELDELYFINDSGDSIPKNGKKAIVIELDFLIKVKAQGRGTYGRNVRNFYIDKVVYYL